MKAFENKYLHFGLIVLINSCFFLLMAYIMPIRFESIDDVRMCMISDGLYSGTPDCHLVFVSSLYGYILASLYKLCGCVEWYSLSFAILQIISMSVVAYSVVTKHKNYPKISKVILLCLLYVLWIRYIQSFQFTVTAGLACFAGCILLFVGGVTQNKQLLGSL